MSTRYDRVLRIYSEVLGFERLHYGLWLPEDELSIDQLKVAQERYETYLIENIPTGVKTILDVGCGTGTMTKRLIGLGYDVEGLSPDVRQKETFTKTLDAKFHHCTFEDFSPIHEYHCIIMSESAQYIRLETLFAAAKQALKDDGYFIVCDYFVLNNQAPGRWAKSGHHYESFMKLAQSNGFKVISENDITDDVIKTLDIGKMFVDKLLLALEIGTEKIKGKRFLMWLFKSKIKKMQEELQLLDSRKFINYKTYRFILFQATT